MPETVDPERPVFLRTREVCRRVGYSKRHIDRLVKAGEFPKPIKNGYRTLAWKEADVLRWQIDQELGGLI